MKSEYKVMHWDDTWKSCSASQGRSCWWNQGMCLQASAAFYYFSKIGVAGSACWFNQGSVVGSSFNCLKYLQIKTFLSMGSAIFRFFRKPGSAFYMVLLRMSHLISPAFRFVTCKNPEQHKWLLVKERLIRSDTSTRNTTQQLKNEAALSPCWHMISKKCSL